MADEALRGEIGSTQIPDGEARPADVNLPRYATRDRFTVSIEHVDFGIRDRPPDRNRRRVGIDHADFVPCGEGRRLGRTVHVQKPPRIPVGKRGGDPAWFDGFPAE